ncbi:MAG: KxYKxGKxW signal peptide domain-containing protein [Desulfovibrio sp.]|nr:KxYKxGKxW signal peptide domain-containing protein [Desulfovibrio sp.]
MHKSGNVWVQICISR